MTELISSDTFASEVIALFDEYCEYFGLRNEDSDIAEEKQCQFEEKFNVMVCRWKGHSFGPDHCGKPEHDFCGRCLALKCDTLLPTPATEDE